MWTRARAVALVLSGLTLAACGNIHPGDAAVVDGRSISMKSLDKTAKVYCKLTLLSSQQQGGTTPGNADIRRQAIGGLVTVAVARKVAAAKGVTLKPQTYELTDVQREQVAKQFPSDSDDVDQAIEDSQETSEIAIALAELSTGVVRTTDNESQLSAAGQAEIVKAFPTYHVHFAPRFGLNDKLKKVSSTGSLSVPDTKVHQPADSELPAAQRCV
jgi:hypothetical protein